jgi:hypothetical protein
MASAGFNAIKPVRRRVAGDDIGRAVDAATSGAYMNRVTFFNGQSAWADSSV